MKINTYPEMNKKIVEYLRIGESPTDMYAAARIEELEKQLEQAVKVLKQARIALLPTCIEKENRLSCLCSTCIAMLSIDTFLSQEEDNQ